MTGLWPDGQCKTCHGTGIIGTRAEKATRNPRIQPNLPCPCGSGKKFKKCCRKLVDEARKAHSVILTCSCVGWAKSLKETNRKTLKLMLDEISEEVAAET